MFSKCSEYVLNFSNILSLQSIRFAMRSQCSEPSQLFLAQTRYKTGPSGSLPKSRMKLGFNVSPPFLGARHGQMAKPGKLKRIGYRSIRLILYRDSRVHKNAYAVPLIKCKHCKHQWVYECFFLHLVKDKNVRPML